MARRNLSPSGIYVIRCTANGRVYVGSSANIANRWYKHRRELATGRHHSRILQKSWVKYGPDAFTWEVVEVVQDTADLIAAEQRWIDLLSATDRDLGFNAALVAGRPPVATPEIREAIAAGLRGKKHTSERRAAMSAAHKGKVLSAEHRAAVGRAVRGRKHSDEAKEKCRQGRLGKKHTPETIAMMSAAHSTPESKEALAARWRGRKHTPETLAKMRARKFSPETRAKMSASAQGRWARSNASVEQLDLFSTKNANER